jgi:hypothetical protein
MKKEKNTIICTISVVLFIAGMGFAWSISVFYKAFLEEQERGVINDYHSGKLTEIYPNNVHLMVNDDSELYIIFDDKTSDRNIMIFKASKIK